MANDPILVADGNEEIEVDYDSDGFPIPSESAKVIDPLPPIDHSAVSNVCLLVTDFLFSLSLSLFHTLPDLLV